MISTALPPKMEDNMEKLVMDLGNKKQVEKLAESLSATGDSDFNETITALNRLASLIIDRAFPKDTDVTPEMLASVIEDKVNAVLV